MQSENLSLLQLTNTHTHTHPFNGPLSGTTHVSRYQKGKTNLDFTGARDSEWQWHQLGHMQVCTSLQTDNHANTPLLKFFTGRMPFLPPNQQHQSTEGRQLRNRTQILFSVITRPVNKSSSSEHSITTQQRLLLAVRNNHLQFGETANVNCIHKQFLY